MNIKPLIVTGALLAAINGAGAHGKVDHENARPKSLEIEQTAWGVAGAVRDVTRTVTLNMNDQMRFTPDHIEVRQGQTVRIRVRNTGRLLHEMVIGTRAALDAHAALMMRFPNMEHAEPYMAHVAAGQTGEIVWTFNRPGDFEFACLIAGHYQAGMTGRITVTKN